MGNICYHFVQNPLSSWILSRNPKVKIYKTLRVFRVGMKLVYYDKEKHQTFGCLRRKRGGEYLDLRERKVQKNGERYAVKHSLVCTLHQILSWLWNQGWDWRKMQHVWYNKYQNCHRSRGKFVPVLN
jgi:hypothetical protein